MRRPPLRLYDFLRTGMEKKPWGSSLPVPFSLSDDVMRIVVETFKDVSPKQFIDLVELPHPHTWLEWDSANGNQNAVYLFQEPSATTMALTVFSKKKTAPAFDWQMTQWVAEVATGWYAMVDESGRTVPVPAQLSPRDVEGSLLAIFAVLATLNSPSLVVRENVDLSRLDSAQKKKGRPGKSNYTYIKLTAEAREWLRHSGSKTYKDSLGRHCVRRHPHLYWTGKKDQERKTIVKFVGPYLRGGKPEDEAQAPRYRIT